MRYRFDTPIPRTRNSRFHRPLLRQRRQKITVEPHHETAKLPFKLEVLRKSFQNIINSARHHRYYIKNRGTSAAVFDYSDTLRDLHTATTAQRTMREETIILAHEKMTLHHAQRVKRNTHNNEQ